MGGGALPCRIFYRKDQQMRTDAPTCIAPTVLYLLGLKVGNAVFCPSLTIIGCVDLVPFEMLQETIINAANRLHYFAVSTCFF